MYCKHCGAEIDDRAVVCPECGAEQTPVNNAVDNGGFGWGLLGFCFPIIGLILFLVWKDTKPRTSKSAGMGALISVIVSVVCYFIAAVLGIGAGILAGVLS